MMATLKKRQLELRVLGCVIALVLAAFSAIRLVGNSWEARSQTVSRATVGTASGTSATVPKERIRYQATIENWRRYRSTNMTAAR
jgi:hypothetical protein